MSKFTLSAHEHRMLNDCARSLGMSPRVTLRRAVSDLHRTLIECVPARRDADPVRHLELAPGVHTTVDCIVARLGLCERRERTQ